MNAASNLPGPLAPFTYVSLSGTNLATLTLARGNLDPRSALGGVHVVVNQQQAFVSFVSPTSVVFLLPPNLMPANATRAQVTLQLTHQGTAGPPVTFEIRDCAPTLFQLDPATAVAAHRDDWTVVTQSQPARAGELVVLYAAGLGPYVTSLGFLDLPARPNPISRRREFEVFLDGQPVDDAMVHYVGAAIGLLGVYQIDLELPASVGRDPEIRIRLGGEISPPGVRLPVK